MGAKPSLLLPGYVCEYNYYYYYYLFRFSLRSLRASFISVHRRKSLENADIAIHPFVFHLVSRKCLQSICYICAGNWYVIFLSCVYNWMVLTLLRLNRYLFRKIKQCRLVNGGRRIYMTSLVQRLDKNKSFTTRLGTVWPWINFEKLYSN